MSKKVFTNVLIFLFALALLNSCGTRRRAQKPYDVTLEKGVLINGIRWAAYNVDAPGTFTANAEDAGMFFQWNRQKGWNATDEEVDDWDYSIDTGTKWYAQNDPCPQGWRVPTAEELHSLQLNSEETVKNGVVGQLFGIAPHQIFLPAVGFRSGTGMLDGVEESGIIWSNTQYNSEKAVVFGFDDEYAGVGVFWRSVGLSVRCVAKN